MIRVTIIHEELYLNVVNFVCLEDKIIVYTVKIDEKM